ncbi:MAG: hypothetical protein ACYS3N_15055 [Planctomycetota bacterium]|jgi:hypothetical protein
MRDEYMGTYKNSFLEAPLTLTVFCEGDEMKNKEVKNYIIGFLLGLCMVFLLGAVRTWHVDGHCQSTLSSVSMTGEVYLAITNTATGETVVHRFDRDDVARGEEIRFGADSINKGRLITDAKQ